MNTSEVKAAIEIMITVTRAIHEAGRIPSGHLYAAMVGVMTLQAYESMIRQIIRTGLVKQEGFELVWIG